jgi:putative PIN family toxin of toxin-antitoxin system
MKATFRAIIDTTVYVSLLLAKRGASTWLVALWKEQRFEVVVSPALQTELVEVLARPKIAKRVDQGRFLALLRLLRHEAIWTPGILKIQGGLRDPQDDFLLCAALESGADFIITGDRLLLEQKSCQGIHIVNPDQFTSLVVRTT